MTRSGTICALAVLLLLCGCTTGGGTPPASVAPATVVTGTSAMPTLGAATTSPTLTVPVSATPQSTQTAAVPVIYGDCGWAGKIETWVDRNEDGHWDVGEDPLPGVLVVASDGRDLSLYLMRPTGVDGRVTIVTGLRGCTEPGLMVSTQWPSGYRPTTAAILSPHEYGTPYRFGFVAVAPVPGTPTRTVQP